MIEEDRYFQTRFPQDPRNRLLWQTLCRHHFSKLITAQDCVLDIGAGYGYFINHVTAKRRIALDRWKGFPAYLQPGIESYIGDVTDLSFLERGSVNFAFASNVFEHISQEEFAAVLRQLRTALAGGGTLNILQPNYYYAYREYFDDYTHRSIYTHTSLCDLLEANRYSVIECRPRFLPLTVKSRAPVSPLLIRLYLACPWKPMGKQMFVRARPRQSE